MNTPSAEAEDKPERVITISLSLVEVMRLEQAVNYYCKQAPAHFDSGPHDYRMRDTILLLRKAIELADPEYAKDIMHSLPSFKTQPSERVIVREVHHHHYPAPDKRPH